MTPKLLLASAALATALSAQAGVSVTGASFTYAQNFDTLAASGTAAWADNSTLEGWSLLPGVSSYGANTGSSTTAGFYSFGSASSSDRALGSVVSNTFSGAVGTGSNLFALALTNNSGGALSSFSLSYDGEQWRNNGNTTAQTLVVQYGFGDTYAAVTTWAPTASGFTFTTPQTGSSQLALDGNLAANRVAGLGGTVATDWSQGATLWLRWVDVNDSGNDHFLAIDNVSLSVSAVPEPGTYAMLLAGLGAMGFIARRRRD
ncbi:MAG: PEP-CTERM sorting domain-containing protein [Roseateles depolymerans]|uniref:PEP-CTERM sorting domain-containing protein n=1 Tax=Roseateles depolymerans TaxID=76731 RepID=A0A2W5DUZ4_9BURK|nr:MAG: PEP-CTERM sorting domain-containing protein [Roseateles depolymerans]